MATGLIALGSNLGDRPANLQHAIAGLDAHPLVRVVARSRAFLTKPIGGPQGQGEFINAAACVDTALTPQQLFALLRDIETELGRQRRQRWAARLVDMDLLLYDDLVIQTQDLVIPHPRMAFRRFVLEPAAEVAPDLTHPLCGWTVQQLLDHLDGAVNYVALTGLPGTGKSDLARRVAEVMSGSWLADPGGGSTSPVDPGGSADANVTKERNLLRRRGELLRRERWQLGKSLSISDFWFDQQMAYGQIDRNGSDWERIRSEWLAWQDRIIRPKLLVMLTAPAGRLATEPSSQPNPSQLRMAGHTASRMNHLQDRLHAIFSRRGQGPTLELDSTNPEWAFQELSAAVEAMQ